MKKLLLFTALLIVINLEYIQAEYLSPGIQIGINSSKEFFYSYQLTYGLNSSELLGMPGVTFGRRHFYRNKKEWKSYNYFDIQYSLFIVGGGIGFMFNKSEVFFKYKFFTGYFGLFTYDYIDFKDKSKNHLGAFGVLPIIN